MIQIKIQDTVPRPHTGAGSDCGGGADGAGCGGGWGGAAAEPYAARVEAEMVEGALK